MIKKLDIDKVDSALKRAAQTAITGRRDERAGRFIARDATSTKPNDRQPDKDRTEQTRKK